MKIECNVGGDAMLWTFIELPVVVFVSIFICFVDSVVSFFVSSQTSQNFELTSIIMDDDIQRD